MTTRSGLEFAKYIGQNYMVAAGLPHRTPDHALITAEIAFSMLNIVAEFNRHSSSTLDLRIVRTLLPAPMP